MPSNKCEAYHCECGKNMKELRTKFNDANHEHKLPLSGLGSSGDKKLTTRQAIALKTFIEREFSIKHWTQSHMRIITNMLCRSPYPSEIVKMFYHTGLKVVFQSVVLKRKTPPLSHASRLSHITARLLGKHDGSMADFIQRHNMIFVASKPMVKKKDGNDYQTINFYYLPPVNQSTFKVTLEDLVGSLKKIDSDVKLSKVGETYMINIENVPEEGEPVVVVSSMSLENSNLVSRVENTTHSYRSVLDKSSIDKLKQYFKQSKK